MTRLKEMKLGETFLMTGLSSKGRDVQIKAKLIENEDNNFIVESQGARIVCDGYEMVTRIFNL